jgi:4-amino-4-deoxy-L-arabinose transferase-like glycosyltransferase
MAQTTCATRPAPVSGDRSPIWASTTAVLVYMALGTVVLHAIVGNRYGFHADELATLDDARHLAWGYPAYPPVTPFFGRISLILFGTSLVGFRFFASLVHAITVVLAGLMARELGGRRAAQLLAGAASLPFCIGGGALMQYVSFDYFAWVLTAYFIVRLLKSGDPRWWVAVGLSIGFGALSKYTIAFFVVAIVAGVLLTDARRHVRSKWLWIGVALSILVFLPNLLWQAQNHFVSLDFLKHIHARDVQNGKTSSFIHDQLTGTFFPLVLAGLYFYFFSRQGKPFRMIGWMYVVTLLLFIFAKGRTYYMCPAYPMVWAGGAVWAEGWLGAVRQRWSAKVIWSVAWAAIAYGVIFTIAYYLPIAPVNSRWWEKASALQETYIGEIGWPETVQETARIRDSLTPEQRTHLGILAGGYGAAGAINLFGPQYGLPRAISGINSYWQRGYGDPPPQTLIVLNVKWTLADESFEGCRVAGHIWNHYGVKTGDIAWNPDIYVCGPPRQGWPAFWKHFRYFG